MILTSKITITDWFGIMSVSGKPAAGSAFGTGRPSMLTEPGMNSVPAGISSVKTTPLSGRLPEFVTIEVYLTTSPLTASDLSVVFTTVRSGTAPLSISSARQLGTYRSFVVINRIKAVTCSETSLPVRSTDVMSYPCLQAVVLTPAAALAFRVPKVPDVSSAPVPPLICEQKSCIRGYLRPKGWTE